LNPHLQYPATPYEMFMSFWRNRSLIAQLTRREVVGRYRGSVLGLAWSFFNPLLMLTVYTFVFSFVFKARWNTGSDSKGEFALVLFIGMIVHGLFAECANRAPGLLLGNISYVKKVVFPVEILPWNVMGSAIFHAVVSLLVWLLFYIAIDFQIHWTVIFVPLIFLPLVIFTMGVSWFLASLGVYLRDIGQIIGVITTVMLFLAPVFYPITNIPMPYRSLLYANPLTFIIEQARDVLMWGQQPDWAGFGIYTVISFVVAWAGYAWFQKTRKGFADVL